MPAPRHVRKDLRAVYGDGVGYSVMVGAGETYIPAFALALGMSEVLAGWIVSIPLLLGATLQLVSPLVIQRLQSHRKWVIACAGAQAVCCSGFVVMALVHGLPPLLLFVIATLYWGTGMASGPAWNTWVGTLVPRRVRAAYFARRSRGCQAAVLLGLVGAGLALHFGTGAEAVLFVFASLFVVAALSRAGSTWCLWQQSEPHPMPRNHRIVGPREIFRRARRGRNGRLLTYMLAVQFAVQISGPFFTPYMLGELDFSYLKYLAIIATAYIAKMVALPFLGSAARRFGSAWLLYATGAGIVPLSALWIFSESTGYLLALQIVGGCVWAGYELATLLLLFDHIHESERTSVLTVFNLANAAAWVAGALLGGLLLKLLGADRAAYHVIFAVSCGARIIAIVFIAGLRRVEFRPRPLAMRVLGVRPNAGSISAPIVTSLATPENGGAPETTEDSRA